MTAQYTMKLAARLCRACLPLVAATVLAACDSAPDAPLVASDIEINAPRPGMNMGVAYMSLRNNSREPLQLTGFASPQFSRVELHETVDEDGVARMRPVGQVSIPPGGETRLEKGGMHLMLMGPQGEFSSIVVQVFAGDKLLLTVSSAAEAH